MVRFKTATKAARVFSLAYLSRNWRHNTLNANELYEETLSACALSNKRQFLAQVTEPQAFVNAS